MTPLLDISVVIPTFDRRERLLALLRGLVRSTHSVREVLVVDAGTQKLSGADLARSRLCPCAAWMRRGRSASRGTPASVPLPRGGFSFATTTSRCPDYLARLAAHRGSAPGSGRAVGPRAGGSRPWLDGRVPRDLIWQLSCGSIYFNSGCGVRSGRAGRPRGRLRSATSAGQSHREGGLARDHGDGRAVLPHANLRVGRVADPARLVARVAVRRDLDSHGLGDNYGVAIGFPPEGFTC